MQVIDKLKGHSKRVTGLAFSMNLNVLVSSGADAQVFSFLFNHVSIFERDETSIIVEEANLL